MARATLTTYLRSKFPRAASGPSDSFDPSRIYSGRETALSSQESHGVMADYEGAV